MYKDLSQAKYGKVDLGITAKISGISLNPSDYIPSLEKTQEARRRCSFLLTEKKALLGSVDAFMGKGQRFLGKNPSKGIHDLCYDIEQELLHTRKINQLRKEGEEMSKADQTAISALYSERLYQELLRHTLALKQQRKRRLQSWV